MVGQGHPRICSFVSEASSPYESEALHMYPKPTAQGDSYNHLVNWLADARTQQATGNGGSGAPRLSRLDQCIRRSLSKIYLMAVEEQVSIWHTVS